MRAQMQVLPPRDGVRQANIERPRLRDERCVFGGRCVATRCDQEDARATGGGGGVERSDRVYGVAALQHNA